MPTMVIAVSINTLVPARYMSWESSALYNREPTVGISRTIAVTVAPDTIEGRILPMELIIGLSATLTGYLYIILFSFSPLARAATT